MEVAVIKTGGKQYVVSKGDTIAIEKLPFDKAQGKPGWKAGDPVVFNEVLLVANGPAPPTRARPPHGGPGGGAEGEGKEGVGCIGVCPGRGRCGGGYGGRGKRGGFGAFGETEAEISKF